MSEIVAASSESPFDGLMGEDGRWSARALQGLMGYSRWENMSPALERAQAAGRNQGLEPTEHFLRSQENPSEQGGRPRTDYRLTRMAAYLTAMNGDPNKAEVAAAQAYFAVSTREAEANRGKSALELLRDQVDMAIAHEKRMNQLESRQITVEARVAEVAGDLEWYSAQGWAKINGHQADTKYLARVGTRAGKLLRQEGMQPGKVPHPVHGTVNSYPPEILREAFLQVRP